MNKLIVVGFMGAGKTLLGEYFKKYIDCDHLDTDNEVLSALGISPSEIYLWFPIFRRKEAQVVKQMSVLSKAVITLGGGAIESPESRAILKGRPVLWLDPGVDVCWERVQKDTTYRPLAANYEDFVALYHKRVPLYRECARWHLQSVSPPEQLVKEVIALTGIRA